MRQKAKFRDATKTLRGETILSFEVDGVSEEDINEIKDKLLSLEVKKWHERRSIDANGYFWQLCDKIAKAIGTSKDTVYFNELQKYGVFQDIEIEVDAYSTLKNAYRYVEEVRDSYTESIDGLGTVHRTVIARCYIGSSNYDSKQMSELISGTVSDAQEIGIKDTWTQDEILHVCSLLEKNI